MQLRIPFDRTISSIMGINHSHITNTRILKHWSRHYEKPNGRNGEFGEMRAQAACWLYCWAMTGMNSYNAMINAKNAFDRIFIKQFNQYPRHRNGDFHEWARKIRNKKPSTNYEEQLHLKLGMNGVLKIEQKNQERRVLLP